jgi:signal transduction histidine kinase
VLLVCSALLPVLVFAGVLTWVFWDQQERAVDHRHLEGVRSITIALDTELSASIRVLEGLALLSDFDKNQYGPLTDRLQRILSTQPSWSAIVVANASGMQLLAVGRRSTGLPRDLVDSETFKRVVTTRQPVVSGLVTVPSLNTHVIEISVPVLRGNLVTHALTVIIDHESWLRFLSNYQIARDATITLLDHNGVIIARTLNSERWVGKSVSPGLLQQSRQLLESTFRNVGLEGQRFYSAHRRSAKWGWVVATGVPAETVEESLRGSTFAMVGGSLLSVGAAIFLAFLFGRRIAGSIGSLARSAKALASGSMVQTTPTKNITEISSAVQVFEEASTLLREREHALNEALMREQQANRGKDEFLAMLSHELRNPLNTITNAMSILNRSEPKENMALRSRAVIDRQVRHLADLVDDLLDVARVTSGKIVLNPRTLNLARTVAQTVATLQEAGRLAEHRTEVDVEDVWVSADETRIEQIVANLVENAIKYTPPGGRIKVRVRPQGDDAVLEVNDSGTGIASDLLPRIFDLFTQGERTLDRSQGGLGLGLTLVRRLVELHRGRVAATSGGLGTGATFIVSFPSVSAPEAGAPEPVTVVGASVRPLHILIVEDNSDGREMLKTLLDLEGHRVTEAKDGPTGLERLLSVRPDVAMVDIGLPGFDGYELARRARATQNGERTRLIALTGYTQAEDRRMAERAGFDAYLVKPIDVSALRQVLAEV